MPRAVSKWLLASLVAIAAFGGEPPRGKCGEDSAQLLDRLLTAHRAARESIRTFQAEFKVERMHPKQAILQTGIYLRSPDGVLIRVGKEGESTGDILVKAGEARTVSRNWAKGNKVNFRASRDSGTHQLGLSDVWQRLLLANYGPNQQTLPFERFVETATSPVRTSSSRESGREIVTVVFSVGTGKEQRDYRLEFDGGVNYLIRKTVLTAPGTEGRTEGEIERFLEAQPGVFVPLQNHVRSYKGGSLDGEWVYSVSNVVVNAPVPADRLKLPAIPSGTILKDRVHETEYPVNENWNRIGPAKPSPVMRVGQPSSEPSEYTAQSTAEARPTSHWIMIGSVVALAAAGAAWVVIRWRRRAAPAS